MSWLIAACERLTCTAKELLNVISGIVELGKLNIVEFVLLVLLIPFTTSALRSWRGRIPRREALLSIQDVIVEFFVWLRISSVGEPPSQWIEILKDKLIVLQNKLANLAQIYNQVLEPTDIQKLGKCYRDLEVFVEDIFDHVGSIELAHDLDEISYDELLDQYRSGAQFIIDRSYDGLVNFFDQKNVTEVRGLKFSLEQLFENLLKSNVSAKEN